ncbi:MAG: imidazole glycerol phosphate synthase subunit HisH [Pseudomonadota bacterium]
MSKIALIDYGAGNIQSVYNALLKIKDDFGLDIHPVMTSDQKDIAQSDAVILPGVGSFKGCMDGILAKDGLKNALDTHILQEKKPFLGICVGMQLLAEISYEHGEHRGLGYLPATVKAFTLDKDYKIPHMGWNKISVQTDHPILQNISTDDYMYFVHSFHMDVASDYIGASCNYGYAFPALVFKDNIVGVQCHPEKSQKNGLMLLRNFVSWKI